MTDAVSTGRCLEKRTAPACVWLVASTFAALALAGCASLGNPPASPRDDALYATSQSNLVSLTEVIEKHPDDPQAYNMRGSVLGEAGAAGTGAGRFQQGDQPRSELCSGLRQSRPASTAGRGRLDLALADYNKALRSMAPTRRPISAAASSTASKGSGAQALDDFNKAIALKPDNAQAYYNRGLLYQGQRQHQFAIDDFSTAIGLTTQKPEPYVARALSHLAVGDAKSATSDLDDAVQIEPRNLQAWTSRGLAYERLGQREKAAGSYARALNINDKYEPARTGFARVGGKVGQTYQTF